MKKTAAILALCLVALSGCGRVDSVDVDSDMKPFEIETAESDPEDETEPEEQDASKKPAVTTATGTKKKGGTTTRTISQSYVKRTGIVTRKTASPSGGGNKKPSSPSTQAPANAQPPRTSAAAPPATVTTAVQTQPAPTEPPVTTIPDDQNPAVVVRDGLTCRVNENGIQITMNGDPVQTISFDTSYMLDAYKEGIEDSSSLINISDFDFDGNYDLFIPSSKDDYNTFGTYYRYDENTFSFVEWQEMAEIGRYASVSDNNTFTVTEQSTDIEYEKKTYEWVVVNDETGEKKLSVISLVKQFRLDSDPAHEYDIYIDYYEYPEGKETIIKREKHNYDENHHFMGVTEIPIEWYIR